MSSHVHLPLSTVDPRPDYERPMLKVLEMVHELHRRGYQRLRIVPGVSATGFAWRCGITPSRNIVASHGALAKLTDREHAPQYSSASKFDYFEKHWGFDASVEPAILANAFLETFPEICTAGIGLDLPYAGWFTLIIGIAATGSFPIAFADYEDVHDGKWLRAFASDLLIPMPPPPIQDSPVP